MEDFIACHHRGLRTLQPLVCNQRTDCHNVRMHDWHECFDDLLGTILLDVSLAFVMVLASHCPLLPMFTPTKCYDYFLKKLALVAHDCEYRLHKMDCPICQSGSLYPTWVVTFSDIIS